MMNTKWLAISLAVLSIIFLSFAQKPAAPVDNGKISDAQSVRLLKVQLDMKNLEQQGQVLQAQMKQLSDTYQHDQKEQQQIIEDAVKEAGKNPEEWTVDVSSLKFVEKPKTPKPEPDKREKK